MGGWCGEPAVTRVVPAGDDRGRQRTPVHLLAWCFGSCFASKGQGLIGDLKVTYYRAVDSNNRVFEALSDPTRRHLLDRLFERDGRTLSELAAGIEMTRFGVMKHLRVLEEAGLVTTRRVGREKLHYLNPVPIQMLYERYVHKFAQQHAAALTVLQAALEGQGGVVTAR